MINIKSELSLQRMISKLMNVSELAWGMYAFSRDPLCDKVNDLQKKEMIIKAIECGKNMSAWTVDYFQTSDPLKIAQQLGLEIVCIEKEQIANRVLFALFTPPAKIEIMAEPIQRAAKSCETMELIPLKTIQKLILGHEIFHFLEEGNPSVYTRTEKIKLWNFLGFQNYSTIQALSEIAGMSFSGYLTPFETSPFALDVILYYNYDIRKAESIYGEIMSLEAQMKCPPA